MNTALATDDAPASKITYGGLRRFNFIMGCLHLAQGVLMLWLSTSFSLPVSTIYLKFDVSSGKLVQNLQDPYTLRIAPMVAIFLLLSRSGPLGSFGLLFTPQAMVLAQMVLVTPIIAALTRQTIEDLWVEYREELAAMNIGAAGRVATLVWDARFSLVTALLAGFGRAAAEVGAIIVVGGNIDGFTRTMTTAIALETSKGDLPLAIGLGIVLMCIVVAINALAWGARRAGERYAG